MKITILIPHYKNGKATAFALSQLFKHKGRHEMDIVVIDNSGGEGLEYIDPFLKNITLIHYPCDMLQSHGIAFDYALPHIKTKYFITIESDSFPNSTNWLDYYEFMIDLGYDAAGSQMQLSGGVYMHPCGAMYKKSVWEEALLFVDKMPYSYFPNAAKKNNDGFEYHLMVHHSLVERFIRNPSDYVDPGSGYYMVLSNEVRFKKWRYSPIRDGVFHNGMRYSQEDVKTYGSRNIEYDKNTFEIGDEMLYFRVGDEPGQWLSYWMEYAGKKVHYVPTAVKWMEGREFQNQEYTVMENGFQHLWGISSYHNAKMEGMEGVIEFKKNQMEKLYQSMPEEEKIPAFADGEIL